MPSDAQKRANAKYVEQHVKQKILKFFPKDHDLYEWLDNQPKQNAYLLGLIRADMETRTAELAEDYRAQVVAFRNGDLETSTLDDQVRRRDMQDIDETEPTAAEKRGRVLAALTPDLMAAECKRAELRLGSTRSLAFQVELIRAVERDESFGTYYVRIGEPFQPGAFYDETGDDEVLGAAFPKTRGCDIAAVTWAGTWDRSKTPYRADGGCGPVPVVIQHRRLDDTAHGLKWVTKVGVPACSVKALGTAGSEALAESLREYVDVLALNLM